MRLSVASHEIGARPKEAKKTFHFPLKAETISLVITACTMLAVQGCKNPETNNPETNNPESNNPESNDAGQEAASAPFIPIVTHGAYEDAGHLENKSPGMSSNISELSMVLTKDPNLHDKSKASKSIVEAMKRGEQLGDDAAALANVLSSLRYEDAHGDDWFYLRDTRENLMYAFLLASHNGESIKDATLPLAEEVARYGYNFSAGKALIQMSQNGEDISPAVTRLAKAVDDWSRICIAYRKQGQPDALFDGYQRSVDRSRMVIELLYEISKKGGDVSAANPYLKCACDNSAYTVEKIFAIRARNYFRTKQMDKLIRLIKPPREPYMFEPLDSFDAYDIIKLFLHSERKEREAVIPTLKDIVGKGRYCSASFHCSFDAAISVMALHYAETEHWTEIKIMTDPKTRHEVSEGLIAASQQGIGIAPVAFLKE